MCEDADGSFTCVCRDGYHRSAPGEVCRGEFMYVLSDLTAYYVII